MPLLHRSRASTPLIAAARGSSRPLLGTAGLCLLVACAGAGRPPADSPAAAPVASAPRIRSSPEAWPRLPGRYGDEPAVALTSLEQSALAALRRSAVGASWAPSTALVAAARELAARAAAGEPEPLARAHVRAALARGLAYDPAPVARLVEAPAAQAVRLLLRGADGGGLASDPTHAGVGAFERGGRAWLVLLTARRTALLAGLPRDVEPGASPVLRGKLLGLSRPSVHLTTPSGSARAAVVEASGGRFSAALRFDAPGRYVVEVVGRGARGPEVAAILTVSCGGAPLGAPALAEREEPPSLAAAEAQVVEAVNATRRARGRAPLSLSAPAAAVARRHSEEMAARRLVAHEWPGSGGVAARLHRAQVPFARARENVAMGSSALEAHRAIEESPAHLENILATDVEEIGCGLARVVLPTGERFTYLTEVFLARVDDGSDDPMRPEARVREALWRERARASAPPLSLDPALEALASRAARDMARRGEPSVRDLAQHALALPREVAVADAFLATRPSEAARSNHVRDPRFRRVGVGLARGDSRHGAGLLWIVVLYTD